MTESRVMSLAGAMLADVSRSQLPESGRFAGITTTAELAAAGITDAKIRTLVRRGVLTPVCRGAWARADLAGRAKAKGARGERLLSIAAAVALAGHRAVASHHDAAVVHGLALLDAPPAGVFAVSRPPESPGSRTGRPGVRMHKLPLPARHVTIRNGIPVTTVARTVIDLARTFPFRAGVVVADSALHAIPDVQGGPRARDLGLLPMAGHSESQEGGRLRRSTERVAVRVDRKGCVQRRRAAATDAAGVDHGQRRRDRTR